jgi:anti-sigma-K factor RskA
MGEEQKAESTEAEAVPQTEVKAEEVTVENEGGSEGGEPGGE